ncbi:MAG: hypothetical protein PVG63_08705 [Anaerolineales bacterium]|jgi:hypothetical protein
MTLLGLRIGKAVLLGSLFLVACSPVVGAASVVDAVPSQPNPTASPSSTPEPVMPTATPFQALEPTPIPAYPITRAGCCGHPQWGADSNWVVFLDRPRIDAQPGLYGVPINGGDPRLIHPQVGIYSNDFSLVAYKQDGYTYVERWADGTRWTIPNLGRPVFFSPSGRKLAWDISSEGITHPDLRQHSIWVSAHNGSEARQIVSVQGGSFIGWLANEEQIIVTGRLEPYGMGGIWRIDIDSREATLLMEVERPRDLLLSPEGGWLAFTIRFEQTDGRNGLWIMNTADGQARRLDAYGSYRWRSEGQLLLIPFDPAAELALWQYDSASGEGIQLTNPDVYHFKIANNDWEVSPDGTKVVYVSAEDYSLWILQLPSSQP